MANVLFFSLVFPPDGVSTAQIMGELATDLAAAGHTVSAVTTTPHYNRDEVAQARQPLTAAGGPFFRSSLNGVSVVHVRVPPKRGAIRSRLVGWLRFHVLGFYAALRMVAKPDVVIVPSPLLSAGAVAWLVCRIRGARYVYNVQEMYPDLAIQGGRLRNPAVIALFRALESFVYRTASAITVITRGMHRKLVERGLPEAKVHYVPNFVDVEDLKPMDRRTPFSREHGLDDRFVVTYAGNIGLFQGLEILVDAAARLRDDERFVFLIVGDGAARHDLTARAQSLRLANVRFLEHMPYARMAELYASSDLCVVPLLDTVSADAIPSKVYRIMACARPVLAMAAAESELAAVVREARAGIIVSPEVDALVTRLREYAARPQADRDRDGDAGRQYVLANVTRSQISPRYARIVESIASPR